MCGSLRSQAIEQERRYSETLPLLELDPTYVNQILQLLQDPKLHDGKLPETSCRHHPSYILIAGGTIEEPEDKIIPRLAITYGVLRRLGFSEDTVGECLRSIHGVDLDQAVEWVSTRVLL